MSQLEKAREATDAADIRAAYAEETAKMISGETSTGTSVTITQTEAGWTPSGITEIAGVSTTDAKLATLTKTSNATITVTVNSDGGLLIDGK